MVSSSNDDCCALPIVLFMGAPGAGKSTQCKKIASEFGFTHLSSGDLLRAEIKSGSPHGEEILSIMNSGALVPLEIVFGLLRNAMNKSAREGTNGFLIDGCPRSMEEATAFEVQLGVCKVAFFFDLCEEVQIGRCIKRSVNAVYSRSDDNIDTIKKRLRIFKEETRPVLNHFKKMHKLERINAERDIDAIFENVRGIMAKAIY